MFPVEITSRTRRRCLAAAAWCLAMISRTVSVRAPTTLTSWLKLPSTEGTRTTTSPPESATRSVPSTAGATTRREGSQSAETPIVSSDAGSRKVGMRRSPQRMETVPPGMRPSRRMGAARAASRRICCAGMTSVGRLTTQRTAAV